MLKRGKFFWKLAIGNSLLIAFALAVFLWSAVEQFDDLNRETQTRFLTGHANAVRSLVSKHFLDTNSKDLQNLVDKLRKSDSDSPRLTLVLSDGLVLADTDHDAGAMENHADRPEIRDALREGWGSSTRYSRTVEKEMCYVAVRVGDSDHPLGVVRASLPRAQLVNRAAMNHRSLLTFGLVALLIGLSLTLVLAGMWTQRIRRLTTVAQTIARGDLAARVDVKGSDEVAMLSRAVNRMTERLDRQLQLMEQQHRTLEAILSCLQEGVIIVDPGGAITLYNRTAERMLGLPALTKDARRARLSVEQWLPNHDILSLFPRDKRPLGVSNAEESFNPIREVRTEINTNDGRMIILARVSDLLLPGSVQGEPGTTRDRSAPSRLLVLTDITDLDRAIRLRTDFVANASHELRTPLSAIRAAVETLEQLDLASDRDAAKRFVSVIFRHSSRLELLVSDLLTLSRMESSGLRFQTRELHLGREFERLTEHWRDLASNRSVQLHCDVKEGSQIVVLNEELLMLALDNLIDNAIKFSPQGTKITVASERTDEELRISVRDEGCGIPLEHQTRVFERFYQVDPARTGDIARGTGLGLSIVKHATTAMGGAVQLQSAPGAGTCVTLVFPVKRIVPTKSISDAAIYADELP